MYLLGVIKVIKVYVAIFDRFLGANKIRDFVIFVWLLREAWQSGPFTITNVSTLLIPCIKGTIYASVHRLGLSTVTRVTQSHAHAHHHVGLWRGYFRGLLMLSD